MRVHHVRTTESGSVLIVTLVSTIAFGALAATSLTVSVSENRKLSMRHTANKVTLMARGELEVAKNLVNASPYGVDLQNQVLLDALSQPEQKIPNTNVRVERYGATDYFILKATATAHGVTKSAEAVVRQVSPASAHNLMVLDHPVGISGAPRGAIHSNKSISFYFPGGNYRDQVTAVEGFDFVAGADANNTQLATANPTGEKIDPLRDVDFTTLWTKGNLMQVTERVVAELEFRGDKAEVKLFKPGRVERIAKTREKKVFSHHEWEEYEEDQPVYETETYWETKKVYKDKRFKVIVKRPVYKWKEATRRRKKKIYGNKAVEYEVQVPIYGTRTVSKQVWVDKWIPYGSSGGASSSGGTFGGSASGARGYWKKVKTTKRVQEKFVKGQRTEKRSKIKRVVIATKWVDEKYSKRYVSHYVDKTKWRTKKVLKGTERVERKRQKLVGYETVSKPRKVRKYKTIEEQYYVTKRHEEQHLRTEQIDTTGVIYLNGDVRKIHGKLDGRVSLIAAGKVRITGDLQYVDQNGETRMKSGKDPAQAYEPNEKYNGSSLLAIMAEKDILYARDVPKNLEINASLVSAKGSVKFEGIGISPDGENVWSEHAGRATRESLRRLGGIVSAKRPVATYIDDGGFIAAGFERGESIMDQNLILSSGNNIRPPFMFESAIPTWIMTTVGRRLD